MRMSTRACACVYARACVCMYVCMCVYARVCVCVCVCWVKEEHQNEKGTKYCRQNSSLRARIRPHPRLFRDERQMCTCRKNSRHMSVCPSLCSTSYSKQLHSSALVSTLFQHYVQYHEPITRSVHLHCIREPTNAQTELFLDMCFP